MQARLGVNIDHVATLRQQRGEVYPDITRAADEVLRAGADQITIHLREDRRHIQDADVALVQAICHKYGRPLNLEMGCDAAIVALACQHRPAWVCLVPEKREERTTEGGLDLSNEITFERLRIAIAELSRHTPSTKISLFVEADKETIRKTLQLPVNAVEIHTGDYAKDYLERKPLDKYWSLYREAHLMIKDAGRGFHAGHGLTRESLRPLLQQRLFEEYNVGHWIVSEALFVGLAAVVSQMREQINAE